MSPPLPPSLSWANMMAAVRIRSEYSSKDNVLLLLDAEDPSRLPFSGVDGVDARGAEFARSSATRDGDREWGDPNPKFEADWGIVGVRDQAARSSSLFLGVGGRTIDSEKSIILPSG